MKAEGQLDIFFLLLVYIYTYNNMYVFHNNMFIQVCKI